MPVLVTGGAGYIGSHAVLELIEAGEAVVVLDNLSTGFEAAVSPAAKLIVGDIGDPTLVESAITGHKIDAIYSFRWIGGGPRIGRQSAALLSQQYLQGADADGSRLRAVFRISSSRQRLRSTEQAGLNR
jgi:nucleoside-diphosphate-sugar epimerase